MDELRTFVSSAYGLIAAGFVLGSPPTCILTVHLPEGAVKVPLALVGRAGVSRLSAAGGGSGSGSLHPPHSPQPRTLPMNNMPMSRCWRDVFALAVALTFIQDLGSSWVKLPYLFNHFSR